MLLESHYFGIESIIGGAEGGGCRRFRGGGLMFLSFWLRLELGSPEKKTKKIDHFFVCGTREGGKKNPHWRVSVFSPDGGGVFLIRRKERARQKLYPRIERGKRRRRWGLAEITVVMLPSNRGTAWTVGLM